MTIQDDLLSGSSKVAFNDGGHDGNTGNGYLNLGNIPVFEYLQEIEKVDHKSVNADGEMLKDLSLVIGKTVGANFDFDQLNAANLNLLFAGDGLTTDTQAGDTITDEAANAPIILDRSIFTAETDISSLSVDGTGGTPTYVLGTDYELVNAVTGEIKILSAGSITTGLVLELNYTSAAKTRQTIKVGKDNQIQGAARIEINTTGSALNGRLLTWIIQNCIITAESGFTITPGEIAVAKLNIEVLADRVVTPTRPYGILIVG